jgi:hypothetical protein
MKAEKIDQVVFDTVLKWTETIEKMFPTDTVLESVLLTSFNRLTPEQRVYIVDNLGTEWYIKLAARLEKRNA